MIDQILRARFRPARAMPSGRAAGVEALREFNKGFGAHAVAPIPRGN